ncbi:hypothetical protein Pcinc_009822 [Petrolisthes cinctipes]|uniref:Uncharacterized protein n=1 Tax=Petrolisthes cinctipes TaxID=88211 RepID=A0AAE1G638_PETCI|nr:hypothetical protein Pcinc_009822 [Petrolisthes cinctipes]
MPRRSVATQTNFVSLRVDVGCNTEILEAEVTHKNNPPFSPDVLLSSDEEEDCDESRDYVPSTSEESEEDSKNLPLIVTRELIRNNPMRYIGFDSDNLEMFCERIRRQQPLLITAKLFFPLIHSPVFNRSLFDLEAFVKSPTIEVLSDLRKQDWLDIANSYKVPCSARAKKEVIKNVVVEGLVTLEVLPADAIDVLTPGTSSGDKTPKSSLLSHFNLQTHPPGEETPTPPEKEKLAQLNYDIQLRRLQMEREIAQQKLEMEDRRAQQMMERELDLRFREVKLKEEQARQELELKGQEVELKAKGKFKASEATNLLPSFDERDVDGYFRSFESLAKRNRGRPNCREYFGGGDNES